MEDKVYAITDMNGYIVDMRKAAAKHVCENADKDDLDLYISIDQMIGLVESNCLGHDDNDYPLLNEDCNEKIFLELGYRKIFSEKDIKNSIDQISALDSVTTVTSTLRVYV